MENHTVKKNMEKIWMGLLLVTPFILWILPADFFDNGKVILCPSRLFFDIECFGCGMTRAIMHLHHFDFESAIFYNSGSILIYPMLVIVWIIWVTKSLFRLGWKTDNTLLHKINNF
jgi:hypothetical protein